MDKAYRNPWMKNPRITLFNYGRERVVEVITGVVVDGRALTTVAKNTHLTESTVKAIIGQFGFNEMIEETENNYYWDEDADALVIAVQENIGDDYLYGQLRPYLLQMIKTITLSRKNNQDECTIYDIESFLYHSIFKRKKYNKHSGSRPYSYLTRVIINFLLNDGRKQRKMIEQAIKYATPIEDTDELDIHHSLSDYTIAIPIHETDRVKYIFEQIEKNIDDFYPDSFNEERGILLVEVYEEFKKSDASGIRGFRDELKNHYSLSAIDSIKISNAIGTLKWMYQQFNEDYIRMYG